MNKLLLLSFVFVLSIGTVFCQETFTEVKDTLAFRKKLTASSLETNTIDADFKQEKRLAVMSDVIISNGHFCFKKENKLRWEYTVPFTYLIVINGTKMFIKDEEQINKYDMESNKMFKEINRIMVGCVSGNMLDASEFEIKYYESATMYKLILKPKRKQMKEFLHTIHLFLDKSDMTVSELKMIEPSEDYTRIVFSAKKRNTPIAEERFTVK